MVRQRLLLEEELAAVRRQLEKPESLQDARLQGSQPAWEESSGSGPGGLCIHAETLRSAIEQAAATGKMKRITARPLITPWTMSGRPKKKLATGRLLSRRRGRLEVQGRPLGKCEARPRGRVKQEARVWNVSVASSSKEPTPRLQLRARGNRHRSPAWGRRRRKRALRGPAGRRSSRGRPAPPLRTSGSETAGSRTFRASQRRSASV